MVIIIVYVTIIIRKKVKHIFPGNEHREFHEKNIFQCMVHKVFLFITKGN